MLVSNLFVGQKPTMLLFTHMQKHMLHKHMYTFIQMLTVHTHTHTHTHTSLS